MSNLSLALKYRPFQLEDVIGQPFITQTFKQASIQNRFANSYILAGNKGSGKTTTARILANLLTCENPESGKLCGKCTACMTIHSGSCMDVIELDGAANRSVEDVEKLIESAQFSPTELKKKVFIIDECLGRNSRINTEFGLMNIADIVNKKKKINVYSYNETAKQVELKPISGWFRNSGKMINKIAFESDGVIYASDKHLISTPRGFVEVKDLKVGDTVVRMGLSLSNLQKQLIYGSLLGDASISKNRSRNKAPRSTNARIRFVHGVKQKKYLQEKNALLSEFCSEKPRKYMHKGFKELPEIETWKFSTKCTPQFTEIYNKVTYLGKKRVNDEWLNEVDWRGIAYWFCDDGSCDKYKNKSGDGYIVTFNTQGFSHEENLILQKWLLAKGINCSILKEIKRKKTLYRIMLDKKSSNHLLQMISDYIPTCMKYKIKGFYTDNSHKKTQDMYDVCKESPQNGVTYEKIVEIRPMSYENTTYDIEVDGNHNYFVSGTLVHNCHQLSSTAISALLKVTEEPPENAHFIFCTTDLNKIPDTILSRSHRFLFKKIQFLEISKRLRKIADLESIKITEQALVEISKISKGSMRDAISYLEQMSILAAGKELNEKHIQKYLGSTDKQVVYNMIQSMIDQNYALLIDQSNDLIMCLVDIKSILYDISEAFRSIMIMKVLDEDTKHKNPNSKVIDLPEAEINKLKELGDKLTFDQLDKLSRLFSSIGKEAIYSINERWILETTLIRCATMLKK